MPYGFCDIKDVNIFNGSEYYLSNPSARFYTGKIAELF